MFSEIGGQWLIERVRPDIPTLPDNAEIDTLGRLFQSSDVMKNTPD